MGFETPSRLDVRSQDWSSSTAGVGGSAAGLALIVCSFPPSGGGERQVPALTEGRAVWRGHCSDWQPCTARRLGDSFLDSPPCLAGSRLRTSRNLPTVRGPICPAGAARQLSAADGTACSHPAPHPALLSGRGGRALTQPRGGLGRCGARAAGWLSSGSLATAAFQSSSTLRGPPVTLKHQTAAHGNPTPHQPGLPSE